MSTYDKEIEKWKLHEIWRKDGKGDNRDMGIAGDAEEQNDFPEEVMIRLTPEEGVRGGLSWNLSLLMLP